MRQALGIAVAVIAIGGCAPSVTPGARFMSGVGANGDFNLPIQSMDERRYATVVRQRYDFSCGSAALSTLLRFHYGWNVGEDKVFVGMWRDGDRDAIKRVGFSLLDMRRYLDAKGLKADGYKVSIDDVAKAGIPGIALISVRNYKHFVVVKGVTPSEVLIGDPSVGLHLMPRAEFETAWNGVYFVLNSEQARGRTAFNVPRQWAAYTRAPIGARFSDPVGLQALALTAPFYRDF